MNDTPQDLVWDAFFGEVKKIAEDKTHRARPVVFNREMDLDHGVEHEQKKDKLERTGYLRLITREG